MEQQCFSSKKTTFNFLQNSFTIIEIIVTQKIVNSLNGSENEYAKRATKKWYVIDSELKGNYSFENPINF